MRQKHSERVYMALPGRVGLRGHHSKGSYKVFRPRVGARGAGGTCQQADWGQRGKAGAPRPSSRLVFLQCLLRLGGEYTSRAPGTRAHQARGPISAAQVMPLPLQGFL